METTELKKRIDNLGNTWENFKSVNDVRLKEVEKKGYSDPLTNNELEKINVAIDEQKERISKMESALMRPSISIEDATGFESNEHKSAFTLYLKRGQEENLSSIEKKALSMSSDMDGGYLVTKTIASDMVERITEISPMRQLANTISISTDAIDIIDDIEQAGAGWTQETAVRTDTDTPKVNKKSISTHELYAQPKATQKLIDDSFIDIEKWLSSKLINSFAQIENASFINGDGINKPKGILSYEAGNSWGKIEQIEGEIKADDLLNLYYSLKTPYAVRATFLMNRSTIHKIRTLKDANGQYVWSPGMLGSTPESLFGISLKEAGDMPNSEKGKLPVAVADFKTAYTIVDRAGIRVLRDPFTDKPFVKFYTTKRVGGAVVNTDAIKLLKIK